MNPTDVLDDYLEELLLDAIPSSAAASQHQDPTATSQATAAADATAHFEDTAAAADDAVAVGADVVEAACVAAEACAAETDDAAEEATSDGAVIEAVEGEAAAEVEDEDAVEAVGTIKAAEVNEVAQVPGGAAEVTEPQLATITGAIGAGSPVAEAATAVEPPLAPAPAPAAPVTQTPVTPAVARAPGLPPAPAAPTAPAPAPIRAPAPMPQASRPVPPPSTNAAWNELQAQARIASSPHHNRRASERTTRWLRLRCGAQPYALELLKVQEVVLPVPLLPLRGTPPATLGIMNLRGQVVPVIDLGIRLGGVPVEDDALTRIVVLEEDGEALGLKVSAVEDVANLTDSQIEPPDTARICQISNDLFRGVARLGSRPMILLDASVLLH
ncbi:chemotaxis protein CheW [Stenotrophomonas sp. Marseille-Q4652]|uniref:chemotaxis protein CheW n=1 Tax=Stenotrophomonas sp. Marseille-Q4652 TaxID=2866595 RepID=UPI001CE443E1|nr:chemotaxis protein CheW [Stenotrophomonas sp. Marseille-Q4652]